MKTILLGVFILGSSFANAKGTVEEIVTKIDGKFRSSSRYVPAQALATEVFNTVPPEDLLEFNSIPREDLLAALKRLDKPLALNRGVVENLIKAHQITHNCRNLRPVAATEAEQECTVTSKDSVSGLPQKQLDVLVEGYRQQTRIRDDEYDHDLQELLHLGVRDALDTDWYKFKMAAIIFENGLHRTQRVTYNMFSRGTEKRPFYVVGGTSLAVDAIKHFRFGERDIQYIKNHPQFENVSPEFFDYLRTWRFGRNPETGKVEKTGWIRAVPEGTVMFANETIMEITSDPLSATLIECLLSPIIDTVTTSATKVARIVRDENGAPVVEGGTRRSGHALLGAYGAMVGMALGTSNAFIARLTKTLPYGSMEHAVFGLFPHEIRAMIAYNKLFPGSTFLIDENDIVDGWRSAVRVAGSTMGGVRIDSNIKGKNLGESTLILRELFDALGMTGPKILVSNRIDEHELAKFPPGSTAHQSVLVGTQAQNPSDANGANIVYKITQVTDLRTGIVRPIAKASEGKVGIPGETETFRLLVPVTPESSDRKLEFRAVGDVIAIKGEDIEYGTPLLVDALDDRGVRTLPRMTMPETAARTREQLSVFAPEVLHRDAKKGVYPVRLSARLAEKQRSVLRQKNVNRFRVGIQIGSFDPVTTAHVKIAVHSRIVYNFDRMLVVPAHQTPVHGKEYRNTAEERVKMLHQAYDKYGIEVDEREIHGGAKPFTVNTLAEILAETKLEHVNPMLFVIVGDDVFNDLTDNTGQSRWTRHQRELLDGRVSWIVHKRQGSGLLDIAPEILDPDWVKLSNVQYENTRTGAVIELKDLNVGNTISSSEERALAAGVDAIFHGVDLQWTFWEARHGREAGSLAVAGSNAIYENVKKLTEMAYRSNKIKSILTKDFHHEIELTDPKWNQEFHAPMRFPPHGMARRSGRYGHEIEWGLKDIFPQEQRLDIPHFIEKKGPEPAMNTLELAPFDDAQFAHKIVDPRVQLVIQKNGPLSYDFRRNPNSEKVLNRMVAKRVFVYGVATDFCVKDALKSYLRLGFETYLVTDAVAGISDAKSQKYIRRLALKGVRLVTTAEALAMFDPGCEPALTAPAPLPEPELLPLRQ